jgi:alpha-glucosidase (family GH31 glycosyl hydrolase)
MYVDIDYLDQYRDFTYGHKKFAELPDLISETQKKHKLRWTLPLDPVIEANEKENPVFSDGYTKDVFLKWSKSVPMAERHNPPNVPTDKGVMYGKEMPSGPAVFPDFFKNVTHVWWKKWINYMRNDLNLTFDGLWIVSRENRIL